VLEDTLSNVDLSSSAMGFADADTGQTLTVTLTASGGTLTSATGGGVTVGGSGTGALTLTGAVADINTFLGPVANIKYTGATNASGAAAATVTVSASDGTAGLATDPVIDVNITAVNDVATLTNLNGDALSFSVGGSAVNLDVGGDATVADVDSANFNGGNVTVSIVANGQPGEDVLQIGAVGSITTSGANVLHGGTTIGTFAGGSAGANLVITLNANATPALVQDLVRALQYNDTDPATVNTAARTVRVTVHDGADVSANQDITVSLVAAPVIDLDAHDSSGAVNGGYAGSFV